MSFPPAKIKTLEEEGSDLIGSLYPPFVGVLLLWLIYFFTVAVQFDTGGWGIYPRRLFGLAGIVTGPLVHGGMSHLISNSAPLFVLGVIMVYFYRRVALPAFVMIYFLTNIAVWLLARSVFHIGASGIVYGMVAFIFWNGLFRGSARSIVLALGVLIFYSGMFVGILPDQPGISWESHLLGSLVGIFTSYWFRDELEEEEADHNPFAHEMNAEKVLFLPADIFEKTKLERAEEARLLREELERRRLESEQRPPDFWTSNWA